MSSFGVFGGVYYYVTHFIYGPCHAAGECFGVNVVELLTIIDTKTLLYIKSGSNMLIS